MTYLAVKKEVAASTQNQAFNALLFFFRHVLGREFGEVKGVVRAKRRPYVPVTLSKREVEVLLEKIDPRYRLVAGLLYGCGLRLRECVELRVQCVNLDAMLLTVHDGKGQKDRSVPLPQKLREALAGQIDVVRRRHQEDLHAGYAGTFLPKQLEKKYRNAAREFVWQWLFPAATLTTVTAGNGSVEKRRFHIHDSHVQAAVKRAAEAAGIMKRVTPHILRHTFASHLLLAGYDLPTIQKLLGHENIKTTMIYLQTVPLQRVKEARSPLDCCSEKVASIRAGDRRWRRGLPGRWFGRWDWALWRHQHPPPMRQGDWRGKESGGVHPAGFIPQYVFAGDVVQSKEAHQHVFDHGFFI